MLIDWFTVGAQVLNFAILVWLMRRFLYRPVLDAIAAREKRIADTLADADAKQAQAQKDRDDFARRNAAFDRDRADLLSRATADADAERQRLMSVARQDADALTGKRREALADEAISLGQALRGRTQREVFAIVRQTLGDLAGASLEASACAVFTQRLRALAGADREILAAALGSQPEDGDSAANGAWVRSAFELPEPQRIEVQKAVDETFSIAATLRFETAPDLIGGIELSAQGHKFAWSISDYLASLDRGVTELLKAPAASVPSAA